MTGVIGVLVAFAVLVDCGFETEQGVGIMIIFSLFQLWGRGGGWTELIYKLIIRYQS